MTRDPGLQPERTALAWQRTGLSAGVVAILLLRIGVVHEAPLELVAGGLALAVGVFGWLIGSRRPENRGAPRRVLLAMTAATCATGVLATLGLLYSI